MSSAPSPPRRPRGRRPGQSTTAEDIERAARELFAEHGFSSVSLRDIAARAGVSHSLLVQRFGTKEQLFVTSLRWPFEPDDAIADVMADGPEQAAARLVGFFVEVWDAAPRRDAILVLLRRATEQDSAAQLLREFVATRLLEPLVAAIDPALAPAERHRRASLVSVQLLGMAMSRYVLRIEPLASWPAREVQAQLTPVLELILHASPASAPA